MATTVDRAEAFGALLRRYRLSAGLSQEALATRAGLGATTIAARERGRHTAPRPETTTLLAEALALGPAARAALLDAARAGEAGAGPLPAPAAAPGLVTPTSSAASVASVASALPAAPTPLIGREREVAAVVELLGRPDVRVLTLTGPGGVGKTRLALAVAAALQGDYPDGVAFVDLSALRDPALVAATVARAVGLRESGDQDAHSLLTTRLRDKRLLLALDNFEQVAAAAPLVAALSAECSRLTVLVTSRMALRVRVEQRFRVPPLGTPDPTGDPTLDEVADSAAVRLFAERARAARSDFAVGSGNAAVVAEICQRLDGLPLAIELAAARVSLLPPTTLLARLGGPTDHAPLRVLGGGSRDLPERQRTVRDTVDWSYHLLDPDAQRLFARLGVFAGGCALEAIEAVCGPDGALDILDGVTALADASLLSRTDGVAPRVTMLETLHEYAREQLDALGELAPLRRAHALYYAADVEASRPEFKARQKAWLERWEPEHDNVRAALRWALESGEVEVGLRLAGVLWPFWYLRGHVTEGRRWLEGLLEGPGTVAAVTRAEALRGAAGLASDQGDLPRAEMWCREGLTLYRAIGETRGIADMLNLTGTVAREQGAFERATAFYEESLALCRAMDDTIGVAVALNNLGTTWRHRGQFERAAALYAESLALRRRSDDTWGIAYALHNLGDVARDRGDPAGATTFYEESLALRRDLGDRQGSARTLVALGAVARDRGDVERARASYAEGLTLSEAVGDRWRMAFALAGLAGLAGMALARGHASRAARLLRAVADLRAQAGFTLSPSEDAAHERLVTAARTALGDGLFEATGAMLSLDQAIAEARAPSP